MKSASPRIQHSTARSQRWFFAGPLVTQANGIVFSPVEHDGNIQQSDEEVARVKAILSGAAGPAVTEDKGGSGRSPYTTFSSSPRTMRKSARCRLRSRRGSGRKRGQISRAGGSGLHTLPLLQLWRVWLPGAGFYSGSEPNQCGDFPGSMLGGGSGRSTDCRRDPSTLEEMMLINLFCKCFGLGGYLD